MTAINEKFDRTQWKCGLLFITWHMMCGISCNNDCI